MSSRLLLVCVSLSSNVDGEELIIQDFDVSLIESKSITRPKWAGAIKIQHDNNKIQSVEGILVPMKTGGRTRPPTPLFGKIVDAAQKKLDRGHVIALQLGGPDIPENIVAQNSAWNENGAWRHLEKYLLHLTRHLMGFRKSDSVFNYHHDPNQYYPPKFSVKYLVKPSKYDVDGAPGQYHGFISVLHQPITTQVIDGQSRCVWRENTDKWILAEQFNFTMEHGKNPRWSASKKPFDWVQYKAPASRTTSQPIWKDFGEETQAFIDEITCTDPLAKSAMCLRMIPGTQKWNKNTKSRPWSETTIPLKSVILWNTIFVVVLLVIACFRRKIKKIQSRKLGNRGIKQLFTSKFNRTSPQETKRKTVTTRIPITI